MTPRLRPRFMMPRPMRAGLLAFASFAAAVLHAASTPVGTAAVMPGRSDHTALSWREGPPYFTSSGYSSARRFLRLETGCYSAEFDTERIAVTGFARPAAPRDASTATRAALAAETLPPARLELGIRVGTTYYSSVGRRALALDRAELPESPLEFPVRIIESGRFFQKFALHDLEFRDASGRSLPADAYLEISAWPDRLAFTLVLRPKRPLAEARAQIRLQTTGGMDASVAEEPANWPAAGEQRVTLTVSAAGAALAPTAPESIDVKVTPADPRARAIVAWDAEENCHRVRLVSPHWPMPAEGVYPESKLDAWETFAVAIENTADASRRVHLNFDHEPVHSLTGTVPMLLDEAGLPSGLPVQVGKNWHHVRPGEPELPHAGSWLHGRTVLELPPRSRVALHYGVTFARWGGVPTASLAQLSLVGWGHNGFWEQFALGAFGETVCFQPGRAMRRALLADFRPLFQRGFARDERWGWTSNLGGSDTMIRLDRAGNYVPFKRNVTRHVSPGPNLAQLDYEEISADGAVHSRVSVSLPRTDDVARVYLRINYTVLRGVEFSSLSLYQLGTDYYNDSASPRIAWGNAAGLAAEHRPAAAEPLPRWQAQGELPWFSLHGQPRADIERGGQGVRGVVVREWHATLGGRSVPTPWFAATRGRIGGGRLGAEIAVPPGVTTLLPGDRVEMLLELLALPLAAERYYGPDEGLRAALAAGANTWRPVHREARLNRPTLTPAGGTPRRGFPLELAMGEHEERAFTLAGGLGWVPVRLTGLARPDAIELFRETDAGRERVVQGDPARAFWQSDYDVATKRWSVTYNLPASAEPVVYVTRIRASEAAGEPLVELPASATR